MSRVLIDLRVAFRQLRTYPLESALIIVALAVGVGALSAVAALYGVSDEIMRRLRADLSAREFTILPATADSYAELNSEQLAVPFEANNDVDLRFREEQLDELLEWAPAVDHTYFRAPRAFITLDVARSSGPVSFVFSVTEGFADASSVPLQRGSWFSSADHEDGRRVVVLTESEDDLMRLGIAGDPLGQELPMSIGSGSAPFAVIGILDPEHDPGEFSSGYVPYSPTHTERPNRIYAVVNDYRDVREATEQLRLAVERIWGGAATVQPPASLWQATAAERNRALLLAGFASVGLLMACLNITNLMLARVRRRERAYAVQRSLGARQVDIRRLVLMEAGLIGLLGGLLGVALTQALLNALLAMSASTLGNLVGSVSFPPIATVVTLLATILVAAAIGLIPAVRAGNTNIIPGAAASTAEYRSSMPRVLRRNPARLVLSGIQLFISGAAIVAALHIVTLGDQTTPGTDHFLLTAVAPHPEQSTPARPMFTQASIDTLLELAPAVMDLAEWDMTFSPGLINSDGRQYAVRGFRVVSPNYFDIMGVEIVAGDVPDGTALNPPGLLLEQGVADVIFGSSENALGRQLTIRHAQSPRVPPPRPFQVVGIYSYGNQPQHPLTTVERVAAITMATSQPSPFILASAEAAQAQAAREQLVVAARATYGNRQDVDFMILDELTTAPQLRQLITQTTFIVTIMAITAIALAAIGILSLATLDASERTLEIGVKRALGASGNQIAREVTGTAMSLATAATLAGIAAAWLAAPALTTSLSQSLLSGLSIPLQGMLALATISLIALISTGMGWLVGQRAVRANPGAVLAEDGV